MGKAERVTMGSRDCMGGPDGKGHCEESCCEFRQHICPPIWPSVASTNPVNPSRCKRLMMELRLVRCWARSLRALDAPAAALNLL